MTSRVGRWTVRRLRSTVSAIHGLDLTAETEPTILIAEAADRALVLGSSQSDADVDRRIADRLGLEIVRRRSGGGAVLVEPGDLLWVDVVIGAGDPLWDDDVGRAFHWLGEVWAAVVDSLGHSSRVHRGPYERTAVSDIVCFAGRGPGEVFVGDAKVLGMAQRRTRSSARFQCALALAWVPETLIEVFHSVAIGGFAETVCAAGMGLGCAPALAEQAFLDHMAAL